MIPVIHTYPPASNTSTSYTHSSSYHTQSVVFTLGMITLESRELKVQQDVVVRDARLLSSFSAWAYGTSSATECGDYEYCWYNTATRSLGPNLSLRLGGEVNRERQSTMASTES